MRFSPPSFHRGFTLIELLVVLAIVTILGAISLPAMVSLTDSSKVDQATVELTGLLEQSRQYAVGQNTYVWVVFHPSVVGNADRLTVAMVSSKDGTDPRSYGAVPSDAFALIGRVRTFDRVQLKNAGVFTSSQVTDLPATPVAGSVNSLSTDSTFNLTIPGESSPVAFTRSIHFTPTGQARNGENPIDLVEFALQPARTTVGASLQNVAVMRVNGLTGQTLVYRP